MNLRWLTLVSLFPLACAAALAQEPAKAETDENDTPNREELEKKFAAELNGATLVGHFSIGKTTYDKQERYELSEVSKVKGGKWLFKARIMYGQHDVTVPMYLDVKWAGDTPVITLTDLDIPGLGKYTARVLIYRGQYAGTWSGADHGGQLFGHVEKKQPGDTGGGKSDVEADGKP